ncbi:MAG: hypothetical protein H7338_25520 [Candidatus Sericytochromatia bacterium]|nr:hypothetical protein [Candidatus Sericytochromatia bacterium]
MTKEYWVSLYRADNALISRCFDATSQAEALDMMCSYLAMEFFVGAPTV